MSAPVPMLLWCPLCTARHVDAGDFATKSHHTHACQECGHVWRPAIVATVGVQFLPGFKDGVPVPAEEAPDVMATTRKGREAIYEEGRIDVIDALEAWTTDARLSVSRPITSAALVDRLDAWIGEQRKAVAS